MAKITVRAIMALLVTFLVGCGTFRPFEQQQQPHMQQQQRPVQRVRVPAPPQQEQPAIVAAPQQIVGEFPTSRGKPQGKPWQTMHQEGFTGDYQVAGKLLGLNAEQTSKYEAMHSAGSCVVMDVPDGVVLDRLTFTRNGKHQIDYGAKVALQNPPSRKTEVCDLGGGVVAMRFHGCNNHGVVRGWNKPLMTVVAPQRAAPVPQQAAPAPQPQPAMPMVAGQCPKGVRLNIWEAKAVQVQGVQQAIAASRSGGSYTDKGDVSRHFGGTFRKMNASGQLTRSTAAHPVTVSILKQDGRKAVIFQGLITGEQLFPAIRDFEPGDAVQVVFQDLAKFHSPISDLRAYREEFGGCITNLHAIEK